MVLETKLQVDIQEVLQSLGYAGNQPDETTLANLTLAAKTIEDAATPRWNWARFGLLPGQQLENTSLVLPGKDVEAHLKGCHACFLFCLSLGMGVEQRIRAAEAVDMAQAVLLDTCASVLVEQYADLAQTQLLESGLQTGEYATGRFSPGYGDLPITLQSSFLQLLNAQRAVGLSVSTSNILLPRKSITALLGVADHAVTGKLAGCANCALREKCIKRKSGKGCAAIEV